MKHLKLSDEEFLYLAPRSPEPLGVLEVSKEDSTCEQTRIWTPSSQPQHYPSNFDEASAAKILYT